MTELTEKRASFNEVTLLKLAREIAMDIRPIDELLVTFEVTQDDWQQIQSMPYFQTVLRGAIEDWHAAGNTPERVKLKSLAFVEEALPEFYARAHDPKEPLNAKVEVLKTIAKFAGVGGASVDGSIAGERLVVNISLGQDHKLKIEKDITPQTIEGTVE